MIRKQLQVISLATILAAVVGCRREEIRVYVAPKDPRPQEVAHSPHDGHDHASESEPAPRPRPQLSWKLPSGWREVAAGQVNVATFSIEGGVGQEAQVTVTPLPKLAGRDAVVVNMWRKQVGLEALAEGEVAEHLKDVVVGGESGKLFEVEGRAGAGEAPSRIITAMVHRSDASWFYKLSGDAAVVEAQKPAFIEFLKSIQIKEASGAAKTESMSRWNAPSDWKELPAGQMQIAKFVVPERDGAKAEVFVSVFSSDTGGTLANVNRWRRQIGLRDISDAELPPLIVPLDPKIPGTILVNMTNNNQQLVAAIVPRGSQWFFYKLIGGAPAVAAQKEAFVQFAASAPAP